MIFLFDGKRKAICSVDRLEEIIITFDFPVDAFLIKEGGKRFYIGTWFPFS